MLTQFSFLKFITAPLMAPLMAMMLLGASGDALAAKAPTKTIVWKKGPAKTVVVKKPVHVVKVRPAQVRTVRVVSVPRTRVYSGVRVVRPYGHSYLGFGLHTNDADAFAFLGLTALTLAILDEASESQQRAHEQAFIRATTVPAGEIITWNDSTASGSVTVVRTGTRPNGQPCREFQQTVTIGGQEQRAYGIACRQRDGAWRIVN